MAQRAFVRRPDTSETIRSASEALLEKASALGRLPTPIDDLIAASRLQEALDPEPFISTFLGRLKGGAKEIFLAGIQKVRGIADLRERAIYIPRETSDRRRAFVKAHELGHQVLPWHQINAGYRDTDLSLGLDAQELFDQEANFFAAEVIFQGRGFRKLVRSYAPTFDAAFRLADQHGASRHATLWRLAEEQDEAVAVVPYYPSKYAVDAEGSSVLRRINFVASPRFQERFGDVELPDRLRTGDPWAEARDLDGICSGTVSLDSSGVTTVFEWQSWWNSYCLFVLLRRRPALHVVGRILRGS